SLFTPNLFLSTYCRLSTFPTHSPAPPSPGPPCSSGPVDRRRSCRWVFPRNRRDTLRHPLQAALVAIARGPLRANACAIAPNTSCRDTPPRRRQLRRLLPLQVPHADTPSSRSAKV